MRWVSRITTACILVVNDVVYHNLPASAGCHTGHVLSGLTEGGHGGGTAAARLRQSYQRRVYIRVYDCAGNSR